MTLLMGSNSSESYTLLDEEYKQFSSFPHEIIESPICDGLLGECIYEDEMAMELIRRKLAKNGRYISYDALKKDYTPCKRRGNSYYGCGGSRKANPYKRGCSKITHCARSTD